MIEINHTTRHALGLLRCSLCAAEIHRGTTYTTAFREGTPLAAYCTGCAPLTVEGRVRAVQLAQMLAAQRGL